MSNTSGDEQVCGVFRGAGAARADGVGGDLFVEQICSSIQAASEEQPSKELTCCFCLPQMCCGSNILFDRSLVRLQLVCFVVIFNIFVYLLLIDNWIFRYSLCKIQFVDNNMRQCLPIPEE